MLHVVPAPAETLDNKEVVVEAGSRLSMLSRSQEDDFLSDICDGYVVLDATNSNMQSSLTK